MLRGLWGVALWACSAEGPLVRMLLLLLLAVLLLLLLLLLLLMPLRSIVYAIIEFKEA